MTEYVLVLKANSCNKFAICKACKTQVSYDFAYHNKIVNTKKCVKQHLWFCENFLPNTGEKLIENKARSDEIGVSLILDGWVNVVNQNLLGSVLVTSKGEVLVWRAKYY